VREQTETMQRERELLAAGKDIRDLMGARFRGAFSLRRESR